MNRIVPGVIGALLTLSAAVTYSQGGQPPEGLWSQPPVSPL